MKPTWVAFLLGGVVWVPFGIFVAALLVAGARGEIERRAYMAGLEDGKAEAIEKVREKIREFRREMRAHL